jgi:hypothetical protein
MDFEKEGSKQFLMQETCCYPKFMANKSAMEISWIKYEDSWNRREKSLAEGFKNCFSSGYSSETCFTMGGDEKFNKN